MAKRGKGGKRPGGRPTAGGRVTPKGTGGAGSPAAPSGPLAGRTFVRGKDGIPNDVSSAYTRASMAWAVGPARIYDVLAEDLVAHSPIKLKRKLVLDLGAGRGAATRAANGAKAHTVALDVALGMVAIGTGATVGGIQANARALPLRDACVDAVVAAYSLNHMIDPANGLREARRVTRPGGAILASSFTDTDDHPAKQAVEAAARSLGWKPEPWAEEFRLIAAPQLATTERFEQVARDAGLTDVTVEEHVRMFYDLSPRDLVAWRIGMAQLNPFLESIDIDRRKRLANLALDAIGDDPPPVVRRSLFLVARA